MTNVFIVDACRTPTGRLGGALAHVRPDDLAAHAIGRLLARHPGLDPASVEDIVWGAANQAGEDNRNVGRMAALLAGLPVEVPAQTVNRLCGSSLQAVISAVQAMRDGWGDVMIAGGSESMSRAPFVLAKPPAGFTASPPQMANSVLGWRFVNDRMQIAYPPISLGMTAEVVAERYGIGRERQDEFALRSHQRAVGAQKAGRFDREIEPIEAATDPRGKGVTTVDRDEGPRPDTSLEALAALRPVFKEGGSVTAGNSSPMNDGSAALLLATEEGIARHQLNPLARIVGSAAAGVHPDVMGIGPVPATQKALDRAGMSLDDVGMIEMNEAFAAQTLACIDLLGADNEIVNVSGGAIALGHPLGGTGAKILTTLVHGMNRDSIRFGLATMCIGVGQGIALILEGTT
ncbi:MAG: thiolase family protein [Acidimicrobiia bacterium]|nr:thiolase family protein [Acidimicrobiia bacterium]